MHLSVLSGTLYTEFYRYRCKALGFKPLYKIKGEWEWQTELLASKLHVMKRQMSKLCDNCIMWGGWK